MDIISRIKQYMEYRQLSNSQFADAAGIPRPTLSQLLNGRNKTNEGAKKISSDIIRKIHDAYPQLNVMWLLFGDGDMEIDGNIEISEPQNAHNFIQSQTERGVNQEIQRQIPFDEELTDFEAENAQTENTHIISPLSDSNSYSFAETKKINQAKPNPQARVTVQPDTSKKVQSIMVFYSDNSFEIFKPSE